MKTGKVIQLRFTFLSDKEESVIYTINQEITAIQSAYVESNVEEALRVMLSGLLCLPKNENNK